MLRAASELTDRELDTVLRAASEPQKPDEYWIKFPKRVRARLRDKLAHLRKPT